MHEAITGVMSVPLAQLVVVLATEAEEEAAEALVMVVETVGASMVLQAKLPVWCLPWAN